MKGKVSPRANFPGCLVCFGHYISRGIRTLRLVQCVMEPWNSRAGNLRKFTLHCGTWRVSPHAHSPGKSRWSFPSAQADYKPADGATFPFFQLQVWLLNHAHRTKTLHGVVLSVREKDLCVEYSGEKGKRDTVIRILVAFSRQISELFYTRSLSQNSPELLQLVENTPKCLECTHKATHLIALKTWCFRPN